ncbi:MAG TPA: hypothetical protein DCL77_05665, partial [Prolixibacteraceae bacterium]|nr:hypothetical protein [Prolixibacteraceae bacterium]
MNDKLPFRIIALLALFLIQACAQTTIKTNTTTIEKVEYLVAQSPPMGWNSYNCFGGNVTEAEVKANADYMAKNLRQYGWEY